MRATCDSTPSSLRRIIGAGMEQHGAEAAPGQRQRNAGLERMAVPAEVVGLLRHLARGARELSGHDRASAGAFRVG